MDYDGITQLLGLRQNLAITISTFSEKGDQLENCDLIFIS